MRCTAAQSALKIDPPFEWTEFGKGWFVNPASVGDVVQATFRVKLSSSAINGQFRLVAYERDQASGALVSAKDETLLTDTTDWQDVVIQHVVEQANMTLRVGFEMFEVPTNDFILIDYVVFGGSSKSLNAGVFPDHEIQSSAFSLLVEGDGRLGHLRELGAEGQPLGENMLSEGWSSQLWLIRGFDEVTEAAWTMKAGQWNDPVITDMLQSPGSLVVTRAEIGDEVNIEVTIEADSSGPAISFTPVINGQANTAVVQNATVPFLYLTDELGGDPTDDYFFIAGADGSIANPYKAVNTDGRDGSEIQDWREYPGAASMQFLSFYDGTLGFSLSAHDANGESKALAFGARNANAPPYLKIQHQISSLPGSSLEHVIASYPVVIEPAAGSWMEAADNYRDWALEQDFAMPPAGGRANWVEGRPTAFEADLKPLQIGAPLVALDRWDEVLDAWEAELTFGEGSSPLMPLFRQFEKHGTYTSGPDMLPLTIRDAELMLGASGELFYGTLHDQSEIEVEWELLESAGRVPLGIVAALKWAISRLQTPWPPTPGAPGSLCAGPGQVGFWTSAFDRFFSQSGGPTAHSQAFDDTCVWLSTDPTSPPTSPPNEANEYDPVAQWDTTYGRMCAWDQDAKDMFVDLAIAMAQSGGRVFLFDQMQGGRTEPCWNPDHDHAPGYGSWMAEQVIDLIVQVRAAGQAASLGSNVDFGITMEDPGELWIPHMDVAGVRPDRIHEWPSSASGVDGDTWAEVVPAFQYVYSSLIQTWTWDHGIHTADQFGTPLHHGEWFPDDYKLDSLRLGRVIASGAWSYINLRKGQLATDAGFECPPSPGEWPYTDPNGDLEPMPDRADPAHKALIVSGVQMGQTLIANGGAKEYLQLGKMVRPEGHMIDTFEIIGLEQELIEQPTVALTAWELNGHTGILLVNCQYDTPSTITRLPDKLDGKTVSLGAPALLRKPGAFVGEGQYDDFDEGLTIPENGVLLLRVLTE